MRLFIPFPLILLMPFMILFYLLVLPFLLVADLVFVYRKKPFYLTRSGWVFIEMTWAMRGLTVDVKGPEQRIFIKVF